MTPQQQSALEGVVGRVLTADDIAQIAQFLADRNDVAIAAILSVGRTRIERCEIGIGTILSVMAPGGGAFLDALEALGATDRNAHWAMDLIRQGRFDIGMVATRTQVQALAAANPAMASAITALLAVAEVADPLHYNTVSDALNAAEGRLTL